MTGPAARAIALTSKADVSDVETETVLTEVNEAEAKQRYRDPTTRAQAGGRIG
jgi:hypothetical protein